MLVSVSPQGSLFQILNGNKPPTHLLLFWESPKREMAQMPQGKRYLLFTMGKFCDSSFPDFPFGKLNLKLKETGGKNKTLNFTKPCFQRYCLGKKSSACPLILNL